MTRLLILGNSHTGALRRGDDAFLRAYPGVQTGYFAAPGTLFLRGQVDEAGRFSTLAATEATRKTLIDMNGALDCDLNDWDQVLVIGHRLRFTSVAGLLNRHDLLEGSRTGKGQAISWALVMATVQAQIEDFLRTIRGKFPVSPNITFFAGPFVASSIVERAPSYALAQTVVEHLGHPDLAEIYDWWVDQCEAAVTGVGFGFLRQPDSTLDGPGLTHPRFAVPKASDGTPAPAPIDHRHMNGDFGFAILSAFAQARLGLTPTDMMNHTIQETQQ
ncbi:MAG: hypothetical protein MUE52_00680 [Tabrizicola sp.]|jgi:hypothetical protein|nr:hypothetical protein [Tabrizicola sp.]